MPRKKTSSGKKQVSRSAAPKPAAPKPAAPKPAARNKRSSGNSVQGSTKAPEPPQAQSVVSGSLPQRGTDLGISVREAHCDDIPELEQFVERFVQANRLLPRTTDELYDLVPFGFVAYADGRLVGFAALEIYSAKLAEVRSLAVHEDYQGRGIGKRLVQKCVDLAHMRNILEVMAITSADGFFKACGFDFTLPGEKKALFMQTRDEY